MVNYEEQLKVVIFYLKSLFNFLRRTKPYHLVFPTYFDLQICYLLLYYLLTCLCQPRPVYLIFIRGNCRQLLLFNGAGDENRTRTRVYLMGFSYYSMSPQPHFCVVVWSTSLPYLFRLRQLVYTLYTFINNRLFLKLHLSISLSVWAVTLIFIVPTSPSCPSTYYLIQHGVLYSPSPFQPASTLRVSSQALSTIITQQYPF